MADSMELSEADFDKRAAVTLRAIEDALADVDPDQVDVSASDGVVRLTLPGNVRIVVNSHRAARQVWLAAIATAWHFDPQLDGTWRSSKSGESLGPTLAALLQQHAGVAVTLAL